MAYFVHTSCGAISLFDVNLPVITCIFLCFVPVHGHETMPWFIATERGKGGGGEGAGGPIMIMSTLLERIGMSNIKKLSFIAVVFLAHLKKF